MHEQRVRRSDLAVHLANGLQERQPLDVADGTADLDQRHIRIVVAERIANGRLDLVRYVRYHLDGTAQILGAAPLVADQISVNLSTGHIAQGRQTTPNEAFIVAQIEIRLRTFTGDEHLAVLVRRHGSGIDVQVGIQFQGAHAQAAAAHQHSN